MKKFSFIILHYNTYDETLKCIECISKLSAFNKSQIIVVNNASTDDSFEKIKKGVMFENIELVDSEYNTGFAKGNNIGYTIAKHKYHSEFIICLNSDVFVEQKHFLEVLENEFSKLKFDLLGPAIINLSGKNQNPVLYIHDDLKKVNKTLLLNKLRFIKSFFGVGKIKENKNKYNFPNQLNSNVETIENVPIHGSCVVASSKFISNHEFLFYPDTFLYAEEDILYFLSQKNKEKIIYSSSLKVIHAEDAATDNKFGKDISRKKRFLLKNSSNSLRILKKLMKTKSEGV